MDGWGVGGGVEGYKVRVEVVRSEMAWCQCSFAEKTGVIALM